MDDKPIITNEQLMSHNIVRALDALEQSAKALQWIGENFNQACKDDAWKAFKCADHKILEAHTAAEIAAGRCDDALNWLDNIKGEYISRKMEEADIREANTY